MSSRRRSIDTSQVKALLSQARRRHRVVVTSPQHQPQLIRPVRGTQSWSPHDPPPFLNGLGAGDGKFYKTHQGPP
jgi:hypothetical protein